LTNINPLNFNFLFNCFFYILFFWGVIQCVGGSALWVDDHPRGGRSGPHQTWMPSRQPLRRRTWPVRRPMAICFYPRPPKGKDCSYTLLCFLSMFVQIVVPAAYMMSRSLKSQEPGTSWHRRFTCESLLRPRRQGASAGAGLASLLLLSRAKRRNYLMAGHMFPRRFDRQSIPARSRTHPDSSRAPGESARSRSPHRGAHHAIAAEFLAQRRSDALLDEALQPAHPCQSLILTLSPSL